jgi:hypothetical protein
MEIVVPEMKSICSILKQIYQFLELAADFWDA